MEILFTWIYKEKLIKEQGFNFSPEYEFKVEKVNEQYILSGKQNRKNFFENDKDIKSIKNITAM